MQQMQLVVLLALAVPTLALNVNVETKSSLSFDAEAAKNRPVTKVVTLLKDMLKALEKEGKEDEEVYDQMACWCTTNDKEKTKAIDDAEAHINDLRDKIEELVATSARLTAEIANLEKEIAANAAALEKAKGLREKELAEFNAQEKDMVTAIASLKSAIEVLSKHHGGAFLQELQTTVFHAAEVAQTIMRKHSTLLQGVLTRSQIHALNAFVRDPENYAAFVEVNRAAPNVQSYSPQSGQIFGILKQMKETFETDLADMQKEELGNQKAYEELKAAKEAEIATAEQQKTTKTEELATADEKLSESKQDLEDTEAQLSADEQYLMKLKEKCSLTDQEWEERQKTRQEEMAAISKAIAILSSDEAMDTFTKTFNPAFLQMQAETHGQKHRRASVSKLLSDLAKKHPENLKLASLAVKVRKDAFAKVIQAIDDMIAELLKEKEDEIVHKDFCTDGLNKNIATTEEKERQKTDLETLIEDLTQQIDYLTKEINRLKAEISEMQVQMKRAGEDREKANREFQQVVADQRATQKFLAQAMKVLEGFYGKAKAAMVAVGSLKKQEPAGPPPPPGFKAYKKSGGAGGVMGMIQQIMEDAKAMEAEALKGEEDAQKGYEEFIKETNAAIEERAKEIVNKSEEKAKAEADKVAAEEAKADVEAELETLSQENADLHKACDFVLKNFDIRQTAREEEIEALKQAKAILSGSKFEALLNMPR